jgi:hypothetical protein
MNHELLIAKSGVKWVDCGERYGDRTYPNAR